MRNNSGKWWMLSHSGEVIEGDGNPDAASVLAAPGAEIPGDVVKKYDLAKRLDGPEPSMLDSVGRPIVVVDGRSISVDALPVDHPDRVKAEEIAKSTKPVAAPSKPTAPGQPPIQQPPAPPQPPLHQPPKPAVQP